MRSVRLGELAELLKTPDFSAWWAELARAASALRDAAARHEELVSQSETTALLSEHAHRAAADALSRAGDAEGEASRWSAEAQALENRALELVGQYEEQRFRTSDLWVRLGGAERAVEERREAAGACDVRTRPQADAALRAAERAHQALQEQYQAEDRKRSRLWDEVEAAWATSFERSLLGAEHAVAARGIRRDAERLFKEAEERRGRARQLAPDAEAAGRARGEARERRAALLEAARARFGCAAGTSWLYWRNRDDRRSAFAVALADDPDGANLEVKALRIYAVRPQRGVAFLEPARDGLAPAAEDGDRRVDEYLLGPRKGLPRDEEGGPSGPGPATP